MNRFFRSIIALIVGAVIFIGLPLLSWGLKQFDAFFLHPVRVGYVILTILLQIMIIYRMPGAGTNRGKKKNDAPRHRFDLFLIQILSLSIVIAAPYSDGHGFAILGEHAMLRYMGLILYVLGFMLMHWSESALNEQFSVEVTIQENHKLITSGPYRYIRHPRYVGIMLFSLGISFIFRSWLALILAGVFFILLVWRVYKEDALLHREFKEEWEAYAKKSWRLIPFIF